MASENKKRKLKNSFFVKGWLKNKHIKLKRGGFYNSSQRTFEKNNNQPLNNGIID